MNERHRKVCAAWLGLLLALLASASAQAAALNARYRVFLSASNQAEDQSTLSICPSASPACAGTGLAQASVLYDQQDQYARAVATAGVLRAHAEATWPEFVLLNSATASASITDTISLRSRSPDVDQVIARMRFAINGSLAVSNNGVAEMSTWLSLREQDGGPLGSGRFTATRDRNGLDIRIDGWGLYDPDFYPLGAFGEPFGEFALYLVLPVNRPILLFWDLDAAAFRDPGNFDGLRGSAAARLANTADWLGIDFFDGSLEPLDGIELSSVAGYDWSTATVVPLPAAGWLFTTALIGLGALRPRPVSAAASAAGRRPGAANAGRDCTGFRDLGQRPLTPDNQASHDAASRRAVTDEAGVREIGARQ